MGRIRDAGRRHGTRIRKCHRIRPYERPHGSRPRIDRGIGETRLRDTHWRRGVHGEGFTWPRASVKRGGSWGLQISPQEFGAGYILQDDVGALAIELLPLRRGFTGGYAQASWNISVAASSPELPESASRRRDGW